MKLIVLLSCLSLVQAEVYQGDFVVNGVKHYREILFDNLPASDHFNPYHYSSIAVDNSANILYVPTYDNIQYVPAILNISSRQHTNINSIPRSSQCLTVDQETHNVYIGTSNGIYKYNQSTDVPELVGAQGVDVWRVYLKGVLYYNKWYTTEIYTLINGESRLFDELKNQIHNFIIDNEGNILYLSYKNKLYSHKKGTDHDILYEEIPVVYSLTTDTYGKVYVSSSDGIYVVNKDATVKKVVSIDKPREIAFDNENNLMYYSTNDAKIYRLKPILETINATDRITSSNDTDNYSDQRTDEHKLEVTSNNDIRTELQTINKKIDSLPQVINKLLTNILENQLPRAVNSPRTIHLDSIVLKNINISLNMDEAGVGQMAQVPNITIT